MPAGFAAAAGSTAVQDTNAAKLWTGQKNIMTGKEGTGMFLRTQGFKKLLKEAVAGGGLLVGNDGAGTCLCGNYWVMWIKDGCIPKKELAAIIELAGEVPEPGEAFRVYKEENQYEIMEGPVYNVMKNAEECTEVFDITRIVIRNGKGKPLRILQDRFRRIILIDERFIDMIDNTVLDMGSAEKPAKEARAGRLPWVFWYNNIMALHVMPIATEKNKNLISYLEETRIEKMEKEHAASEETKEET